MNNLLAIPCLLLFAGCPSQGAADYGNTYLIPDGYHGWLVIREKPEGKPRPREITYRFDGQGFCISDIKLGTDLFYTHYFYVDPSGHRQEIPSGDYSKEAKADQIYVHSVESTAAATSDQYKGEVWHLLFVGTPSEYEVARQRDTEFLSRFNLYATVEGAKS